MVAYGVCGLKDTKLDHERGRTMSDASQKYSTYDEVPQYRKQLAFWLMFVLIPPIALGVLLFGDVYYQKKGEVKSFGVVNRVVAAILSIPWIFVFVGIVVGS